MDSTIAEEGLWRFGIETKHILLKEMGTIMLDKRIHPI